MCSTAPAVYRPGPGLRRFCLRSRGSASLAPGYPLPRQRRFVHTFFSACGALVRAFGADSYSLLTTSRVGRASGKLPNRRDAVFAQNVMFHVRVRDHIRHLKLPQNFRRPNAMRAALTNCHVTDAHEIRSRGHHDLAVHEREKPETTPWGKSQLERDAMVLLSYCVHNLEEG